MTLENLKKHHARLVWLASGEFTERDFDYKIAASENTPKGEKEVAGWCTMGEMSSKRKQLIQQDAQRTLARFERKYSTETFKPNPRDAKGNLIPQVKEKPVEKPKKKEKE